MSSAHTVWSSRVDLESRVFDELGRYERRILDRHDLVRVTLQNQDWYIDLFEVLSEVRLRECLDAGVRPLMADCIPWIQNESGTPCEILASGLL